MAQVASPQGKEEKNNVPWRIAFTRKDLLAACWNNGKMADLLYHFLHVGSCTIENNHLAKDTQVVVIQDTHTKILAKVKVSEPTLISFLKIFAQVGYVRKVAHKKLLEVNFANIERAFTNPPVKPVHSDDLNLNLNIKNEQSEEVQKLTREVEKLTAQVQDLSLTLVSLKVALAQFEHEFKFNFSLPLVSANLNQSSESALEADAEDHVSIPLLDSKSIENLEYREREKGNSVVTPLPCAHPFLLLDLSEDIEDEAQPLSYSHNTTPTTSFQASLETGSAVDGAGYTNDETPVNPPERPNKRTSKSKVEQPGLPLQVDLGPLVMPANDAPWNAGTSVLVSEVLRERRYTPKAREDQLTAARKMFKEFPAITREQFEKAFTQRNDAWWHEHVGLLTIADLMAKDNSKAIRLSKILERLDTKPATNTRSTQKTTEARPGSWREHYENDPNNGGYGDEASIEAFLKAGEEIVNAAV